MFLRLRKDLKFLLENLYIKIELEDKKLIKRIGYTFKASDKITFRKTNFYITIQINVILSLSYFLELFTF